MSPHHTICIRFLINRVAGRNFCIKFTTLNSISKIEENKHNFKLIDPSHNTESKINDNPFGEKKF